MATVTIRDGCCQPRPHIPPCLDRARLAGVKRSIFRPELPTLRQMERDDMMCKLPEEHCRHTTRCTAKQFEQTYCRPFKPPVQELHCLSVIPSDRAVTRHYSTPGELQDAHRIWSCYVNDKTETKNPLATFQPSTYDWHFDGVALRVIRPELRDWRMTSRCEPGLDQSGIRQRITPSDHVNRHRPAHPDLAVCCRRL